MTTVTMGEDSYRAALAAIHDRSNFDRGFISDPFAGDAAARRGLARTAAVLADLGNPHHAVPLIHVAGSKGKGSTTVMLDAILRAAGLRSGRYTSPHLHTYRERIVVDDRPIGEANFAALTADVLAAVASVEARQPDLGQVTAFELLTVMSFAWFARSVCDVAVIEVGLGGTLDSSNVIEPVVSVITRLDLEHTAILGETLAEIAANKAGIIKPGRPVVTVAQEAEALAVIVGRAEAVGSDVAIAGQDWQVEAEGDGFAVSGAWGRIGNLRTALVGPHQEENAALALAALKQAGDRLPPIGVDAIRQGLASARYPGRFEEVPAGGKTVILDGAHTPVAAAALAATLAVQVPEEAITFVIGMLSDKHPEAFLAPLMGRASRWVVTAPQSPRRMEAAVLAEALSRAGENVERAESVSEAIDLALTGDEAVIVVTGSLQTVAEARMHLGLGVPDPPLG